MLAALLLLMLATSSRTALGQTETSTQEPSESASLPTNQDDQLRPQVSNSSKLRPVNFSLVEEMFESVLADDEVVRRWRQMDSQLQDGMKSILKMLFPQIVSISQDAKVSGDCSGGILKWILSLRNLRSWAIKSKFM